MRPAVRTMMLSMLMAAAATNACTKAEDASAKTADAAANSPAKSAPPPAPRGRIPSGATIALRPESKICTNTHKVGDRVNATVIDGVVGENGASIPSGATAALEVTESQYGRNDGDAVRLAVRLASVTVGGESYPVSADVTGPKVDRVRRQSTGQQVGKVATGAAIGAVVGKVAGKSTGSTVAGAAVGAAAGGVVAAGTADYDGCINADARLVAKLSSSIAMR
ncbi:MAG TPA: hypothetical protein VE967_05820 [Gemmatimonadaceae bacterium]|nr:hypothetical protein [Gemmatimonadaceae bacterium]